VGEQAEKFEALQVEFEKRSLESQRAEEEIRRIERAIHEILDEAPRGSIKSDEHYFRAQMAKVIRKISVKLRLGDKSSAAAKEMGVQA
jgi:hypothetical protein